MTDPRNDTDGPSCEPTMARQQTVLAVLLVGTFLAPLDSSIVNIALPSIASQFGESLASVGWVASAYLLTSATLLLTMGRVGDVWGLRRLYVAGLLLFGGGSLLCALASSVTMLVGFRVLQAVGASMLFAAGPALVAHTFPPNRRGWALGYVSLSVAAGLTIGPALGGLLVGTFGWPSIFWINVPLSVVAAGIAWRLLPRDCPPGNSFDVPGAVLAGATLLLFLVGLGGAEAAGLGSVRVIAPVAGSVVVLGAFIWWEQRAKHPMVDLRLFESRVFSAGIAAATMAYAAIFALTFTLPFFLTRVQGMPTRAAGLVLTVTPLAMAAFAPLAGRISDRSGSRHIASGGLLMLAAGLLAASFLATESPVVIVIVCLLLVGTGMSLFQTPNTAAVLRATPRARAGVGSAFVAEARNVGMAVGIAVTAAIVGLSLGGEGLPSGVGKLTGTVGVAFVSGMSSALRFAALVALAGAFLAWYGRDAAPVEDSPSSP